MASKPTSVRVAIMPMGMWFLTTFFGNFIAGALGESWGAVVPTPCFVVIMAALAAVSLLLFLLVRKVVSIMHGVTYSIRAIQIPASCRWGGRDLQ